MPATDDSTSRPVPMLDINRQNQPLREPVLEAITEVCDSGAFLFGPAVKELEAAVADYCDVEHAVGCASGSDALLLAMMAMGIGAGDEVILPSFTFFASAGSVWRLGAKPVFADLVPETYNLDPEDVARKITPATRAIMPVHLFGQSADMTALGELAREHNIDLIEDAAQAIGAKFDDKPVCGLGRVGCISFYPTKNLGGFGDGGMITTNDAELADKIRVLCNHGQRPRYMHHYVGVNSRLDTIQAAVLGVKLKELDNYAAARSRHAAIYNEAFEELTGTVVTPQAMEGCGHVWNQYTIRVTEGRRDALQQSLADSKIGSAIYYPVPLHMQPCFASLGHKQGDLPHSELAAEQVLSLPVFPEMTAEEQQTVIGAVKAFCQTAGAVKDAA